MPDVNDIEKLRARLTAFAKSMDDLEATIGFELRAFRLQPNAEAALRALLLKFEQLRQLVRDVGL